jgi:dTDP-4-dehydrorhamnose reductase
MRILITGAFGQLGSAVSKRLSKDSKIIRTGRSIPYDGQGIILDILNQIHFKDVIDATKPDVVIHLAGMTGVDDCQLNPKLAKEINIAGVQHLCDSFKGKIIRLSTDYVFDGKNGPYSELDPV